MASVTTNGDILPESDWLIWRVLVLMMAGILGGTIYPIVTDGYIEMPRFVVNQGAHFKAGLFGDILLGIAGATILELLLPAEWSILSEQNAAVSSIAVAATGIIGGYGGRAMLRFALQRVVRDGQNLDQWSRQRSRQKQADTPPTSVESTLEDSEVTTASTQAEVALTENLIASLGQFVAQGGSEQQLRSLKQQIQDLSVSLKPALFDALVVQRQALELSAATSEQEPLPQPLPQPFSRLVMAFSTLADSGWQDHRCYGQMALIYDLGNPNHASVDPAKAIAYLDRAIASRGALALGQTWTYELHKAAIRILQAARVNSAQSVSAISVANRYQPEIMASLHSISQVYNLATIVASPEAQPHGTVVLAWIHQHRAMLATQANTQEWLSEADRKNNTFAETASVEESIANKRVEKRTAPKTTVANAPSATPVENTTLDLNDFVEPANPHNYRLSNCDLLLGQGFNLLTLDPFNLSGSAKSEAIFRFYDGEALEIQDEVRKLHPQGSRYRSVSKGGLSSTSHTNILYTEADAQRFFASSLGGLAAQLLGKILPCSLSGSYEKIKRERRSEKQIFSVTQANYIDYLLDLIWDRPQDLHLDHLFRRAVAQLPLRSELSDGKEILPYLDFIEKFGTHIAVQIQLGGLVHQK
ncbi:MAG: MAC/perforin domain-containing protein, partial [Cyanobacteria bacterium J06555_13]